MSEEHNSVSMPDTGQKGVLDVPEAILYVTSYLIWDRELRESNMERLSICLDSHDLFTFKSSLQFGSDCYIYIYKLSVRFEISGPKLWFNPWTFFLPSSKYC